jgi:acyl transferase domain-containing protein
MSQIDHQSSNSTPGKEPIAIIGIGCRFPGGVNSSESFWQLLGNKIDAITEIPSNRIDLDLYYDPRPATPGKMMTRWGGFLEGIDQFDAYFFGISPREAERLDPQQRLLLEVAWEALEDAGLVVDKLAGSQAGVFVGMWLNDYEGRMFVNPAAADFYMTTGSGRYSASGRISYTLGFQGPSLTIDTACSSSLVAVHLACQSLWSGECELALAGGANIILQPHISIAYSQSRMMAPDGHCKFGDAQADGYVRSEGAGLVVLKPLSQAMAAKDPIYAVIRGSAVNNDGRSSGYLATPGQGGQEEMLRLAYQSAGISPNQVQYIEAHGTGTRAGDPVELGAIGAVVSNNRPAEQPCLVGSVKTNFGHTEGAAGVAGLIKVALSLKHRAIPASLHLHEFNPNIPWQKLGLTIPTELAPWPAYGQTAVGGVSSFGIAGTNAHVVLSEAPSLPVKPEMSATESRAYLLPLSAQSAEALKALAGAYQRFLNTEGVTGDLRLEDICYSAGFHRTHHPHRLALVAESRVKLAEQLEAFFQDKAGAPASQKEGEQAFKTVFIFPGQGSQWLGMGRQLLEREPIFRQALEQFEQAMRPFVDWSLLEQLALDESSAAYRLNEIDVIQPTLLSVEIALAWLWRSWGIEPDAVIGHSMGEVAAAHVAGGLEFGRRRPDHLPAEPIAPAGQWARGNGCGRFIDGSGGKGTGRVQRSPLDCGQQQPPFDRAVGGSGGDGGTSGEINR